MQNYIRYRVKNPDFGSLGYITAIADTQGKHDRSTPSNYHWKVLKCRMIIFSNASIMASPDKDDLQQVHVVFNKMGDDYDKLVSLYLKFSLAHDGCIWTPSAEVFQMCFTYTLTSRLAPLWNTLATDLFINNRHFLTTKGPQDGIRYNIWCNDHETVIDVKPVKIHFIASDVKCEPGEWIRVLPSLNKATIEEYCESLPTSSSFKCYKDLRRHWKNIHGYRIPEQEGPYFTVRFWRGEPLTYPKICVVRNLPIVTPVPKPAEKVVLSNFLSCLKCRMGRFLGAPLALTPALLSRGHHVDSHQIQDERNATQAISLCTPTQPHYEK